MLACKRVCVCVCSSSGKVRACVACYYYATCYRDVFFSRLSPRSDFCFVKKQFFFMYLY